MSIKQNYKAGFMSGQTARGQSFGPAFSLRNDDSVTYRDGQVVGRIGQVSPYVQGYIDGYDTGSECPAG